MPIVIIPNELRDQIDTFVDKAIDAMPEPEREGAREKEQRKGIFQQVLEYYNNTGQLPDDFVIIPTMTQEEAKALKERATKALRRIMLGKDVISLARVEALERAAALFPEDDPDVGWAVWAVYDIEDRPPIGLGCAVVENKNDAELEEACRVEAGMIEDPEDIEDSEDAEDPEDAEDHNGPFTFACAWTRSPWPDDIVHQAFEVATADS